MNTSIPVIFKCFFLLILAALCMSAAVVETESSRKGRIVGGWATSIERFPHQVSLQILHSHICGGSLIDRDIVVTAAHCVARYSNPRIFTIRAGSSYSFQGGVMVGVKDIKMHEDYGKDGFTSNDIAVLKLTQPLEYSKYIQPIGILETSAEIDDQQQLWVTGWGLLDSRIPQMSPILRYTSINKLDFKACQESYKTITEITANMLCAGVKEGGRDSCQGDSGGPLIAHIKNSARLVGIVSFGYDCAKPGYPGVYTRVQNFHSWLNKTIEEFK